MNWKNIAALVAVGAAATLSIEFVVWLFAR